MEKLILSPSLLAADFARLGQAAEKIAQSGGDWIHLDIMDGRFVPPITFGHQLVSDLKKTTGLPLDVHLMIEHPEDQIESFCRAGADLLTVHYEGNIHHHRLLEQIRRFGARSGISIVPSTPVEVLSEILPNVDLVLVMSVDPGFGGQDFIPSTLEKLARLSEMKREGQYNFHISVDGGIRLDNAQDVIRAGADVLVTGSAFFGSDQPKEFVRSMKRAYGSDRQGT